jgi:hypothetical protein
MRRGVAFRQKPGKHAAGTNVSRKSLRWDWRLEGQLKSQGKWLGFGGNLSVGLYVPLLEFNRSELRALVIPPVPDCDQNRELLCGC